VSMIYQILDDHGDRIFAVVVREGGTLLTISPATGFQIVEREHDGKPFPKWVPNKFSGWKVEGSCDVVQFSEEELGPSASVEFATLPWMELTFSRKRTSEERGSARPSPGSSQEVVVPFQRHR